MASDGKDHIEFLLRSQKSHALFKGNFWRVPTFPQSTDWAPPCPQTDGLEPPFLNQQICLPAIGDHPADIYLNSYSAVGADSMLQQVGDD